MGAIRTQKKFCDFRCWHAAGKFCSCWCGGVNHGIGRPPDGFDPKRGLTEDEYNELIRRKDDVDREVPEVWS